MGRLIIVLVVLACAALGTWACVWLGPQMIVSGQPNLILLAYLLPACWLIASVLAYIGWAELAWPSEPQRVVAHRGTALTSLPRLARA